MYIKKYWGNFLGGSDDSLNLVAFLEDQKKEEIPLSEIFAKIGLDKQNWDFRQTVEYLEFTHSDGVEMDFQKRHKVQAVIRTSDKVAPVFFDIHLLRLLFRDQSRDEPVQML